VKKAVVRSPKAILYTEATNDWTLACRPRGTDNSRFTFYFLTQPFAFAGKLMLRRASHHSWITI